MPQSKFGGIPVEDEKPKGGSKFGGVAVAEPPTTTPAAEPVQPQTFTHGITEFGKQINPLPMITGAWGMIRHPLDTRERIIEAGAHELGEARNLTSAGRYSEAFGHGVAGLIPAVGPAAAKIGEQFGGSRGAFKKDEAPDVAGGVGAGAGLITSIVAAPAATKAAGRLIKAPAMSLAKSALGLPGKAEAFGANPALAVLEDTHGVRPSTIARTGQRTINRLMPEREALINSASNPIDLQPARDMVSNRWMTHAREGNVPLTQQVEQMGDALARNRVMGAPYPRLITPGEALELERGFGDEFASYNPNIHEKANALAKEVRGDLSRRIYDAAPQAEPLGRRIQGLIPAVRRAGEVSRNAGGFQRAMDRIARPTGALVPALIGKQIGGIPGLLAGLGVPEMISSPAVKMIAARTLYGGGKLLQSPIVRRGAQAAALNREAMP